VKRTIFALAFFSLTLPAFGQDVDPLIGTWYDGMPHPTTGTSLYDSTAYTRSGNTISWVRFKNGKQVGVAQVVVDPGKTYTAVEGGIDANNRPYYNISVYDRQ
jgi:hypothetical protein